MRILHVVTLVSPDGAFGGPLRVAMNQANELQRRGHEVHIASGWNGVSRPPQQMDRVPAHLFPVRQAVPTKGFTGIFSPKLARWLWTSIGFYDVVHIHAGRDLISTTALLIAHRQSIPYVTQTHGMIPTDMRAIARIVDALSTRRLLRGAAHRFVLTDHERQDLGRVLGNEAKVEWLPNGVPEQPERATRIVNSPPEVLYVARLHHRKRPTTFVEMAYVLTKRNVHARYAVVGPDEGALSSLQRRIVELGLEDRLSYEGALPYEQVLDRMSRADVYVLPSVDEPFPMSLLEALSLGIPSVCTDSCGIASILRMNEAAVISSPSPQALADAVHRLLIDSESRQHYGQAGRRAAADIFSISAVGSLLESCYMTAAQGRGKMSIPDR
jgi:glycosyltransferase involved in cell wall biosynthesis